MKHEAKKRSLPQISEAEWVVMRAVWDKGPLTTNQVVAALEEQNPWKPKTIHTLLRRLAQKRALSYEKQGREYLFRPLVTAAECEQAVSRSFISRFFQGQLAPFLARFVEKEPLTPKQIDELKRILDRSQHES